MAKLVVLSILLFTITITTIASAQEESRQYTELRKRSKEALSDAELDSAIKYLLGSLKSRVFRDRRGSVDFGLISRHLAGSDYARMAETRQHILDPYGPGKRKRSSN